MGYGTKRIKHSAAHARHSGRVEREAFVNSVNGIVWEVALPAWTFTFVSPQAERILGYPLEHWFADTNFWSNHLHPEDRWVLERLRSLVTGECDDRRLEFRMIAADNRIVWFRDLVTVDVSDHGPAFMGGVLFDVSLSYTPSFALAGISGVLNLAVIGALISASGIPMIGGSSKCGADRDTRIA